MKVIVAGMSKTGTKTMYTALSLLGYEVYDFLENYYYLGEDWVKTIREGAKVEDLRRMYKDVDAATDIPCCFYWEEMLEAFPDAKIVLMMRDEESWFTSISKQAVALNNDIGFILILTLTFSGRMLMRYRSAAFSLCGSREQQPWSTIHLYKEEALKRLYRNHNRNVIQNAPKDQLLVYEVKQGWKPLCDFLGIEVPDREFPYKNKGASVVDEWRKENKIMRGLVTELYVSLAVLLVFIAIVSYMLYSSGWLDNFLG